jgi:hypothetical protein
VSISILGGLVLGFISARKEVSHLLGNLRNSFTGYDRHSRTLERIASKVFREYSIKDIRLHDKIHLINILEKDIFSGDIEAAKKNLSELLNIPIKKIDIVIESFRDEIINSDSNELLLEMGLEHSKKLNEMQKSIERNDRKTTKILEILNKEETPEKTLIIPQSKLDPNLTAQKQHFPSDNLDSTQKHITPSETSQRVSIESNELAEALLAENRELKKKLESNRIGENKLKVTGDPEEISKIKMNFNSNQTIENGMKLAWAYYKNGDIDRLKILLREELYDITDRSNNALALASLIKNDDLDLAVKFWHKANSIGINDNNLPQAIMHGFAFGLDSKMIELFNRAHVLSNHSTVSSIILTPDQIRDSISNSIKMQEEAHKMYNDGILPIHVPADHFNWSILKIVSRLGSIDHTPDFIKDFIFFIRSGIRGLLPEFPDKIIPCNHINADITGILLADKLNILDDIVETYKIRVPENCILLLQQMRDKISFHQASIVETADLVLNLADKEVIKTLSFDNLDVNLYQSDIYSELVRNVKGKNWCVVDLGTQKESTKKSKIKKKVKKTKNNINHIELISSLRNLGLLSKRKFKNVCYSLRIGNQTSAHRLNIPKNSNLFLNKSICHLLYQQDLLDLVCNYYKVYIHAGEYNEFKGIIAENNLNKELSSWTASLITKLNLMIRKKKIEYIRFKPKYENEIFISSNSHLYCLDVLKQFQPEKDDCLWIDDRSVNKFMVKSTGVPIFGINEIMHTLVSAGRLAPEDYFEKLMILRQANVRLIPVGLNEILYYLNVDIIKQDRVIETSELKTLKNYISACIFQGYMLEQAALDDENKGNFGDTPFLIDNMHSVVFAIKTIWENDSIEIERKESLSNWIFDFLYIDHPGIIHVSQMRTAKQDDLHFLAMSILFLIVHGTGLKPGKDNARGVYYDWLEKKLFRKLFFANKDLSDLVVKNVKRALIETEIKYEEYKKSTKDHELTEEQFNIVSKSMVQKLYKDLPKSIKDRLNEEPEYLKNYDIEIKEIIEIYGYDFIAEDFYNGVSKAINGCETETKTVRDGKVCTFKPESDDKHNRRIILHDNETGKEERILDDFFRILSGDKDKVRDILYQFPIWFDCPNDRMENEIQEISNIEDPYLRMDRLKDNTEKSAAYHYWRTNQVAKQKQKNAESLEWDELKPPNLEGFINHYRFDKTEIRNKTFRELIEDSCRTLIDETDLYQTFWRLSGLPVEMPEILIDKINSLNKEDKKQLVDRIFDTARSPIMHFHLIYLLNHINGEDDTFKSLANTFLEISLSDDFKEEVKAFMAALKWSVDNILLETRHESLPNSIILALAWGHAHKMIGMFKSMLAPFDWMQETFKKAHDHFVQTQMMQDYVKYNYELVHDIANTRVLTPIQFIISSVAFLLKDRKLEDFPEGLIDKIWKRMIYSEEERPFPRHELFQDITLSFDSINSFIEDDVNDELFEKVNSVVRPEAEKGQKTKELTRLNLNELEKDFTHKKDWIHLNLSVGMLPIYADFRPVLQNIIKKIDLKLILEKDLQTAYHAIQFLVFQVKGLDKDETRNKMYHELRSLIDYLLENKDTGDEHDKDLKQQLFLNLFDSGYQVSIVPGDPIKTAQLFSEFLVDNLERLVELLPNLEVILFRFCNETPVEISKYYWRVWLNTER